jgi:hypothetical protein
MRAWVNRLPRPLVAWSPDVSSIKETDLGIVFLARNVWHLKGGGRDRLGRQRADIGARYLGEKKGAWAKPVRVLALESDFDAWSYLPIG